MPQFKVNNFFELNKPKIIKLEEFAKLSTAEKYKYIDQIVLVPDLTRMGKPSSFEYVTKQSDGFPLVFRPEIADTIKSIDESNERTRFNLSKSIYGVGGSSLLFFLAQYCKLKDWIVIYFTDIDNQFILNNKFVSFIESIRIQCSEDELNKIPFLNHVIEKLLSNKKPEKLFLNVTKVIKCLSCSSSRPSAILVDQWDKVIKEPKNDLTRFLSCFDNVCPSEKGAFFSAMSSLVNSSALPVSAFRDASIITYKLELTPFSEAARLALLDSIKLQKGNSNNQYKRKAATNRKAKQ